MSVVGGGTAGGAEGGIPLPHHLPANSVADRVIAVTGGQRLARLAVDLNGGGDTSQRTTTRKGREETGL